MSSKVYKTNKASISNAENVRIYSCNIHEESSITVVETVNLFQKLGFVIHPDKNKFILVKVVEYLGFINYSEKMVTGKCCIILMKPKLTMRELASFIGTLHLHFPEISLAHCNFNAIIKLSEDTLHEISRWKKNIFKCLNP